MEYFRTAAPLALAARILVALGWVPFFISLIVRKPPSGQPETRREPMSKLGIGLQGVGFFLVWILQRHIPTRDLALGPVEIFSDVVAPIVSLSAIALGLSAVRTLGKQWSYTARLVEGHKLVTEGPYSIVRHPIYTGMLGKLVATNLAFGHPIGLPIAGTVFVIGTSIRVRYEEKLLKEGFGAEFDAYSRKVPAFIPFFR